MSDDTSAAQAAPAAPATRWGRVSVALAIAFGLFYTWDLFEAIVNLVGVSSQLADFNAAAQTVGLRGVDIPWTVLIVNTAVPVVAFVLAWLLGRSRPLGAKALLYLAGLSTVAALSLSFAVFA